MVIISYREVRFVNTCTILKEGIDMKIQCIYYSGQGYQMKSAVSVQIYSNKVNI